MPEFIHISTFGLAFLLTLAAIRKSMQVTGYERFTKTKKDRWKTYLVFGSLAAIVIAVAVVLGFIFDKPVSANIVVAVVAAVWWGLANWACGQYKIQA